MYHRQRQHQAKARTKPAPPIPIPTIVPAYAPPTRSDMAVILVYFNPSSSVRIIQNLLTVKHGLDRAGIPTFVGELAHGDSPFLFAPVDNIRQYRSDSLLFYKENLIRAVEATIPASFTKLFLMDADVLYEEPDWYDRVSAVLDTHEACQPFQTAHLLNLDFTKGNEPTRSILDAPRAGHPGYAWALRRDWFTRRRPSDYAVIGGGDNVLASYVRGAPTLNLSTAHPLYDFLHADIRSAPAASATSCPLTLNHLNHGTYRNRQYLDRNTALQACLNGLSRGLQLQDALERRPDGILEWKTEYRARLNAHVATFFATRSDDSSATGVIPAGRSKFFPTTYTPPPSRTDMAVILVYFNPANYKRPIQNTLLVKHALDRAGIPTFIAELAYGTAPFLFAPATTVFHVRAESVMFHKENLVRYAEARIPAAFTKICVMDADIFYDSPDWYSTVSAALDTKTVVQPFKAATWLDIDFTHLLTKPNAIDPPHTAGHEGFAIAFDRAFFRRFGLEDRCTMSTSGDTLLLNELLDRRSTDPYLSLFAAPHDKTGLQTGSCNLTVYHLSHGTLAKRQYFSLTRTWLDLFRRLRITSLDAIQVRRDDGILEWKPEFRTEFNSRMLAYFKSRGDDSGVPG